MLLRNLANFDASSGVSLKICHLMCYSDILYFCRKYSISEQKTTEMLCVITLRDDAKFEELTCPFKNDVRNLANFDATLKICTLMGFF